MHRFNKSLSASLLRTSILFITCFIVTLHMFATPSLSAQANLSWSAPTTYTDMTPVTNLAGHKIHIGTSSGNYSQTIDVGNTTNYTVDNLNDSTAYYFAVSAYDSAGIESGLSNQAAYTTPTPPPPAALYTLSASAGSGGSITPSGSVIVSKGMSQTYSIVPGTGYKIAGVIVDGVSVGAVSSYTFSNVAANHSISATFTANVVSYTISASAGAGGSISPAGITTVTSGGSKAFFFTPLVGYKIADIKVNGVSVGAVTTYSFSNVRANYTIVASFTANVVSYSISASAGTGGIISPTGTSTTTSGGSKAFTITPNTGYKIADVKVNGVSVGAVGSYTFSNITANHTIAATFSVKVASANIPHTNWKLKYADSQELVGQNGAATNAFDGPNGTIWHTQWKNSSPAMPHEIQINLGNSYKIDSFSYLPRQDGSVNGTIAKYEFYVSSDGVNWGTPVTAGTFANNTSLKQVSFAAKSGQFIRLRALSEVNGNPWTSVAEINVSGN